MSPLRLLGAALAGLLLALAWWGWSQGGLALLEAGLGHCT
ncbi:hypothetical protein SAMN05216272_104256 [Pseudomonas panipatensis]|uniref:Uncharacterized protein n=1 Tax=Pseudomonas panipatensis TaxID=428992 RepID=A0A1G8GGX5_9PSED|nr:hypothetical protein SAMN05216272_104256 [Pseudomonas panipatensis]SMP43358.1 hypothetical protein SAMN06295951_101728 [Pseudomonas panipatensis]